jgi:hypothetical protein
MTKINEKNIRPGFAENRCSNCVHKIKHGHTHHIGCKKDTAIVGLSPHGVANGWACWPLNFDKIWIEHCDSYTDGKNVQLVESANMLSQIKLEWDMHLLLTQGGFRPHTEENLAVVNRLNEIINQEDFKTNEKLQKEILLDLQKNL